MLKGIIRVIIFVCAVGWWATAEAAPKQDTVYLKSGNKITGTVLAETENEVIIQMEEGRIAMDRSEIRSIKRAPAPVSEVQRQAQEAAQELIYDESLEASVKGNGKRTFVDSFLSKVRSAIESRLGVVMTVPLAILCAVSFVSVVLVVLLAFICVRSKGYIGELEMRLSALEAKRQG